MSGEQQSWRTRGDKRRADLPRTPGAELPRGDAGHRDGQRLDERRPEAQDRERVGCDRLREGGDRGCDRRLIDVPPCEMSPAREEVELVAVVAVATQGEKERNAPERRNEQDRSKRERLEPRRAIRP